MFDQWFFLPVCPSPGCTASQRRRKGCGSAQSRTAFKLKKFKISRLIPKTRQPHVFWRNG